MDQQEPADFGTVAIIGLGLIGGSLARDLHARGVRVLGRDRDAEHLAAAVAEGVLQPLAEDYGDVGQADVVVLAIPVRRAVERLAELAPRLGGARLITDVGSTKSSIVRAAEELGLGERFVGSHPMAGDHRSGWSASRAGMFAGARVFLCPTRTSSNAATRLAAELWTSVGARPEEMDADRHDVRLGWTSHLPQLVSTALALTLAETGTGPAELGPGGRDVTRLAGSDPDLWTDILIDNADALDSALAKMQVTLGGLHDAVASGDRDRIRRLFAQAQAWHQRGA